MILVAQIAAGIIIGDLLVSMIKMGVNLYLTSKLLTRYRDKMTKNILERMPVGQAN